VSGILGVFTFDQRPLDARLLRGLLDPMRARGPDQCATWRAPGVALAARRHEWERADGCSGDVLVVDESDLVIAADASLYYRKDLRDDLAAQDVRIGGTTPSHLILAAYRAWGERCTEHLEGDYAFIIWDREQRRVFCSRDFAGSRPLFYADLGRALVVASTQSSVVAHPDCPDDFNLAFLAEVAAGLWLPADETAYQAVSAIPAGSSLVKQAGTGARLKRHWYPPDDESGSERPFEEAALELRELLCSAVDERMAPRGVTSVWLSGGRDSPAVFGAGQHALRARRSERELRPVSISYPVGDPGREDELIAAIADSWSTPVDWLDIRGIPFFDRPAERAAGRDEPYEPLYETLHRALAQASRAQGAHVVLDGWGGDQLFGADRSYLADLLRTGRWTTLIREWQAGPSGGLRDFLRWAVKPALPPLALRAATRLRGGRRAMDAGMDGQPPGGNPRRAAAAPHPAPAGKELRQLRFPLLPERRPVFPGARLADGAGPRRGRRGALAALRSTHRQACGAATSLGTTHRARHEAAPATGDARPLAGAGAGSASVPHRPHREPLRDRDAGALSGAAAGDAGRVGPGRAGGHPA